MKLNWVGLLNEALRISGTLTLIAPVLKSGLVCCKLMKTGLLANLAIRSLDCLLSLRLR